MEEKTVSEGMKERNHCGKKRRNSEKRNEEKRKMNI